MISFQGNDNQTMVISRTLIYKRLTLCYTLDQGTIRDMRCHNVIDLDVRSRSKVTDVEVSAFSKCILFFMIYFFFIEYKKQYWQIWSLQTCTLMFSLFKDCFMNKNWNLLSSFIERLSIKRIRPSLYLCLSILYFNLVYHSCCRPIVR